MSSPTGARFGRRLLVAALLLAGLALLRSDRLVEAARPGDLARLVPRGALVLLETEDLPALAGRWRDCDLRRSVETTGTYGRCRAGRIALRLDDRLELLEAAMVEPITIERLADLPGNRGGLALYSIGDTTFVMWLRTSRGAARRLEVLREDLETTRREVSGHSYYVHQGDGSATAPLAVGVVGDLLIVGNDLERFEQAFRLAAGEGGESLAGDATYRALASKAPASAEVHLYLDMEHIGPTRQFRRYWVHDNADDLAGIGRAMLSVTWRDDRTVEHRVLAYRDGSARMAAGPAASPDAEARLAALPRGAYVSLTAAGAGGSGGAEAAARAARWVWPGGDRGEAPADLEALLAPAGVTAIAEVLRPGVASDGFAPADALAVALLLDEPSRLSTDAMVDAGSEAMARLLSAGRAVTPTRATGRASGVETTTLRPPLPGGPQLAVARSTDGAVIVLATSPAIAGEVAAAAGPGEALGRELRAPGADVARVDYDRAARILRRRLGLIVRAEGAESFLADDVPELLGVPELTRIERLAWRDGAHDRQQVSYVY